MTESRDKTALADIRKKLRRSMKQADAHGFQYQKVFGCDPKMAYFQPHILVRVELRYVLEDMKRYIFRVFMDYHLPNGAMPEHAREFAADAAKAARKATWAEKLTAGLSWPGDEAVGRQG